MNEKAIRRSAQRKRCLLFSLAGVLSGVVNGLLGTGGGILTVFFLSKIYAREKIYSTKDVFAITLCSSLIMSAASLVFYLSQGAPYMLAAIFGGAFGAFLLDRLNSKAMKVIFALLVVWAGISMVIKL